MAIWDIFKRRRRDTMAEAVDSYFRTIGGYIPTFTTFEGGVYEMELTRAAIHCIATHVSKLNPVVKGAAGEYIAKRLKTKPNPVMDTKKYLYRIATLLMTDNNVIIAPLYDDYYQRIEGYYPLAVGNCNLAEAEGRRWVIYQFDNGMQGAVPLDECGIVNQMQYHDELWGESNSVLKPTLEMLHARNESIVQGVKSSGQPRFLAQLSGVLKEKDISDARKLFKQSNLGTDNSGGAIVYDSKYKSVQQITPSSYIVDEKQAKEIKDSVYTYFGVCEEILQNKYNSEQFNAFFTGKISAIALELSMVHTNMTFSEHERAFNNEIMFYANRLQYLTSSEKLEMVTQLFDRGFITHNQGLQIFDMPPVEGGDIYYIRKEYANIDDLRRINGGLATGLGVEYNANDNGQGIQSGSADDGGSGADLSKN